MIYDLILPGGGLIDLSQRLDMVTDIAFAAGKVARIGPRLNADGATEVHDLAGVIVTPGLIDHPPRGRHASRQDRRACTESKHL
jgi:dihydroorotase